MNNFIIITGLILAYLYFRKKEPNIDLWFYPAEDNWFILLVGTLPFENDVMQHKILIMKEGQDNKIEAAVIAGVIAKESKGIANAINGRYIGLMQFGLSEARAMGYRGTSSELLKPEINIHWGTKYLKYCIDQKKGNIARGISGYNTGNVESSTTPFNVDYVNEVASYIPRFRFLLAQSFPGYANVFPKETWFSVPVVA